MKKEYSTGESWNSAAIAGLVMALLTIAAELVASLYSAAVLKSVAMANEYYADFITGQRDIDAEWDNFVKEWNANGGDEFAKYFASIF